jgi:hypothetical protein
LPFLTVEASSVKNGSYAEEKTGVNEIRKTKRNLYMMFFDNMMKTLF